MLAARGNGLAQPPKVRPFIAGQLVIGDVRGVEHGLGRQQRQRLKCGELRRGESRFPQSFAFAEEA